MNLLHPMDSHRNKQFIHTHLVLFDVVTPACPLSFFTLFPISRDKLPKYKRIMRSLPVTLRWPLWWPMTAVHKSVIRVKHVLNSNNYDISNDTYSLCLCEMFVIKFAKRWLNPPGLEMLKNVTGSGVVTEKRSSKISNKYFNIPYLWDATNAIFRTTT